MALYIATAPESPLESHLTIHYRARLPVKVQGKEQALRSCDLDSDDGVSTRAVTDLKPVIAPD